MYLVTCEEIGLANDQECHCDNHDEIRAFLKDQGYLDFVIKYAIEHGIYRSTYDLIVIEKIQTGVGRRKSGDAALNVQIHILAALIAKYPKGMKTAELHRESPVDISVRSLERYIVRMSNIGIITRNKGYVHFTKLGEQAFIKSAQRLDLKKPIIFPLLPIDDAIK